MISYEEQGVLFQTDKKCFSDDTNKEKGGVDYWIPENILVELKKTLQNITGEKLMQQYSASIKRHKIKDPVLYLVFKNIDNSQKTKIRLLYLMASKTMSKEEAINKTMNKFFEVEMREKGIKKIRFVFSPTII